MNNIKDIFVDRIKKENEKRASYNKYIFNSHLVMFLFLIFAGGLVSYSKWLENASRFQLKAVILVVLGILSYILTSLKVKTFIKEADTIFLLPLEEYYKNVKNKFLVSGIILQLVLIIVINIALKPIFSKLDEIKEIYLIGIISFTIIAVVTSLIKLDSIVYKNTSDYSLIYIYIIFFINSLGIVFCYYLTVISVVLIIIIYLYNKSKLNKNINWYGAAEYDNIRQEKYLKFISMFIDVPIKTTKVARRKYLDFLLPRLTDNNFKSSETYNYYYLRIFLRQENTIFLALRLFIICLLFIYSLGNIYVSCIVIISYGYLTIIQLIPLYKKINSNIWSYILPVGEDIKKKSFKKLLLNVMGVLIVLLTLISIFINNLTINNIVLQIVSTVISIFIVRIFINRIK